MLAVSVVILSILLHFVQFKIFGDLHHELIYLWDDLAFLPLEVLLVVLIIERVLNRGEQNEKLQKLDMVIGSFFSEVGNPMLRTLFQNFKNKEDISPPPDCRLDPKRFRKSR
jgi:hypothetical protein